MPKLFIIINRVPWQVWKLIIKQLPFWIACRCTRLNSHFKRMIGEFRQRKRFPLPTKDLCDASFLMFTSGATMKPLAICFTARFEVLTLCTPAPFISGNLFLNLYPPSGGKCIREVHTQLPRPPHFYNRFPGLEMMDMKLNLVVTACPHLVLFSAKTGKKIHQLSSQHSPTCIALAHHNGLLLTLDKKLRQYRLDLQEKKLIEIGSFSLSPPSVPELHESFCCLSRGRILVLLKSGGKTAAFVYSEKGEPLIRVLINFYLCFFFSSMFIF